MKRITIIILMFTTTLSFSQITKDGFVLVKGWNQKGDFAITNEWKQENSLTRAKSFLLKNVLGTNNNVLKFSLSPLEDSKSGELTTLIYKCEELNKSGMILSFWGDYWNEYGVIYKGYDFKNLEKEQAILFLNKIQSIIDENLEYLREDSNNNNISFEFDDMQIVITSYVGYKIRVFWNGFDSTWDWKAFENTKEKFDEKI
ncbi:hypothetical protein [Xanthomarina sp. F2636L]|uniref:hypothetical protein n=1 Tax=Xanthomarina sp. F2636L TaxID=2996018 RepID=UPI00225E0408|nr:hypothetical protein [Xanthomarina sp. F2636L]MCX7551544.1 hypothetical protein [Xanthomarina sp. F2636L]